MNLNKIVKHKTVLEIGCNSGFIACSIASNTKFIVAFDIMEDLIKLANEVKAYKNIKNIIFYKSSFENLNIKKKFDVILSFANHSTYDNQTKQHFHNILRNVSIFVIKMVICYLSHIRRYMKAKI